METIFVCPCCDSELGIREDGTLFILGSLSRRGVTSTHSGDPRYYDYQPDPTPPSPPIKPLPSARLEPVIDSSGELLVDDRTAALVHRALVKDLFDRGIISNTTDH
jgi:hypothetical protein